MGTVILENLLPLLVTVLTPVILMLAHKGMNMLAKRLNMEQALQYESKVDELILKGIKAAEQKAMNALKTDDKDKTAGAVKLGMVLEFVNAQLKAHKLDEKAAKELEMLVEAKIFDGAKAKPALPAG